MVCTTVPVRSPDCCVFSAAGGASWGAEGFSTAPFSGTAGTAAGAWAGAGVEALAGAVSAPKPVNGNARIHKNGTTLREMFMRLLLSGLKQSGLPVYQRSSPRYFFYKY